MERNTQAIAEDATGRPSEPTMPRIDPTSWNGVSYEDLMGSLEQQLSERQTLPREIGTVTAPMPAAPKVIVDVEETRVMRAPSPSPPPPRFVEMDEDPLPPARTARSARSTMGRTILIMTILGIGLGVGAAYLHDGGVGERRAVSVWIARHVPKTQAALPPPPAAPAAAPIATTTAPAPTTTATATPAPITAQAAPTMIAGKGPPWLKSWKKKARAGSKDEETTEIDDASSVLDRALQP